jgi:hypothetical protein
MPPAARPGISRQLAVRGARRLHAQSTIRAILTNDDAEHQAGHVGCRVDLPAKQPKNLADLGVVAHEMTTQRADDADENHPDPGDPCHHQAVRPLPDRGTVP